MKAIIAATIFGIILMFASILMKDKKATANLAIVCLLALFGVNIWELINTRAGSSQAYFNNMLNVSYYGVLFNTLMTGCTLLYAVLVSKEIQKVGAHVAEYFALIFFILCGVYLLSCYQNLLILFI